MFYTVYKITNKINGKIYIGCHKTNDIDDDYMGSGKLIKRAIDKYGVENFLKETLCILESSNQMFDEERNLISKLNPEYNLHEGGIGGWEYVNKVKDYSKVDYSFITKKWRKNISERNKEMIKNGIIQPGKNFLGKNHTEESKRKIGEANSKYQTGSKNSQYGTMWITNGSENKKIKKVDSIPEGWYKGRMKF